MIRVAIEKDKKVQDLNWNETENNPEKESKLRLSTRQKSENILNYVYLPTVAENIVTLLIAT